MNPYLNEIKHRDAEQLCIYYYYLVYKERVAYVNELVERTGIKRCIFFNWKGMASRIPVEMKSILEDIAGQTIFSDDNK